MAGQPGPVQAILAFFDLSLRHASAIIETAGRFGHYQTYLLCILQLRRQAVGFRRGHTSLRKGDRIRWA